MGLHPSRGAYLLSSSSTTNISGFADPDFLPTAAEFEASVLTMCTRAAVLFEGIANNGILIAHGVTEVDELPDPDLQIGVLLALLQDDAKNHSSYLTWKEKLPQKDVAATLRNEFLVSPERAEATLPQPTSSAEPGPSCSALCWLAS